MKTIAFIAFSAALAFSGAALAHSHSSPHFNAPPTGAFDGKGDETKIMPKIETPHMIANHDRREIRALIVRRHELRELIARLERDLRLRGGDSVRVVEEIKRLEAEIATLDRVAAVPNGPNAPFFALSSQAP